MLTIQPSLHFCIPFKIVIQIFLFSPFPFLCFTYLPFINSYLPQAFAHPLPGTLFPLPHPTDLSDLNQNVLSSEMPSQTHLARVGSVAVGCLITMFLSLLPFIPICSYTLVHAIPDECPSSASDSSLYLERMVRAFTHHPTYRKSTTWAHSRLSINV